MSTKPSNTKIDNEIIWRMIKSIHSRPGLREWVTLESQALKPIFTDANLMGKKTYLIHLLLAVPNKIQDKTVFMPPWGYICWQWPSMTLMAMINVSELWNKDNSPHLSQHTVCTNHYVNSMQNAIDSNLSNLDINSNALKAYYEQLLCVIQPIYKFNTQPTEAITRKEVPGDIKSEQVNHGAVTFENTSRAYELLPSHMTAASNLIHECGQKVLLTEWKRIFVAMNQPMFSVALVGEFSSGKSTLVNQLLHEELLPVGNLPTTSKLTRIIYGPEAVIKYMDNTGEIKRMPFDYETCEELIVNNQDSDLNNLVQLEIPNEWLNHMGIQLIDTPGVNEISGNRASLVTEAIGSCDATLVVINATSPLSLTERYFVEQHIFLRHIPRVAVVLTNLDRVKEDERSSLISFLKEEISGWSTDVSLWCSNEYLYDSLKSDLLLAGAKDIREALAGWAQDSQYLELRRIQYGSQLYSLLSLLKDSLLLQKEVLALSEAEQQDRIKAEKGYIEHCRLDWEDLRIELLNRRLSVVKRFESELKDYKTDILDNLKSSLLQVGDPKVWWEELMPTMLRNQFKNKIKYMNISLQHKIIEDAKWLDDQITARFAQHIADVKPDTVIAFEHNNNKTQIADVDKHKTGMRAGIIILSLLSLPFMGPMATIAIGAGGGLISEQLFKKSLQKQKEELNIHLETLISVIIEENINYAVPRIKRIYDNLIGETRLMESTWVASNLAALDINVVSSLETTEVTNRIHKVDQLLSDLSVWMEVER